MTILEKLRGPTAPVCATTAGDSERVEATFERADARIEELKDLNHKSARVLNALDRELEVIRYRRGGGA